MCRASLGHRVTTVLVVLLGALVSVQQRVTEFIPPETNVMSVRGGEVLSLHPRGICGCPSFGVQNMGFAIAVKASLRRGLHVRIAFGMSLAAIFDRI